MSDISLVIGYTLEKAIQLIGNTYNIEVDATTTPFEDKKLERLGNEPIVVRQIIEDSTVKLTTSLFK